MLNIYIPPKDKFDIESIIKRQYKEVNEKFFQRRPEMTIEGKPIIIQFGEKKLLESMDDIPDNYFYELFIYVRMNNTEILKLIVLMLLYISYVQGVIEIAIRYHILYL